MGLEDHQGKCLICLCPDIADVKENPESVPQVFDFLCKLFHVSAPRSPECQKFATLTTLDFCQNCKLLIKSAISTYNQIQLLEQNLETIKRSLQSSILSYQHVKSADEISEETEALRRLFTERWRSSHERGTPESEASSRSQGDSKSILVAFAADGTVVEAKAELRELPDKISIPSTRTPSDDSNDLYGSEISAQERKWIGHGFYDLDGDSKDSCSSGESISQKRSPKKSRAPGRKPFVCYFCAEGFTLVRNLNRHVFKIHGERALLVCPLCGLNFHTEQAPPSNEECTGSDYPFFCRINDCKRRFQTVAELRSHHLIKCADFFETNENAVMFACSRCCMLFSTEGDLSAHASCIHGDRIEVASETRSHYWPLTADNEVHISKKGKIEKSDHVVAVLPARVAPNDLSIQPRRHALEDSNFSTETFKCFHCPKRFLTDYGRRQHAKVHKNVKPLSCAVCYEGFTMLCNLRRHVLKAHFGSSQFSCPLCGLDFTHDPTSGTFQDDNAFVCALPGCSRTFHTPIDLQSHHLAECPEILKLKGLTPR